MVGKLQDAGLVECAPSPGDGRSRLIALSPRGRTLLDVRRERKSAYLEDVLAAARPDELALLADASRILLRLFDEAE
jgi:DNA-binding MarR family transcriptional regulator